MISRHIITEIMASPMRKIPILSGEKICILASICAVEPIVAKKVYTARIICTTIKYSHAKNISARIKAGRLVKITERTKKDHDRVAEYF